MKRLLEDKILSFGPKRKGPNILVNRYLRREDSFFQRIHLIAHKVLGTELPVVSLKAASTE